MTIDCFPFFNELDLLELRLRELDGVVDRFVAVQSVETHAGIPKPIHLDTLDPRWEPWRGRLQTVILPAMPEAKNRWERENATRHVLRDVLADASDHDVVIISDCDEIPEARQVAEWSPLTSHSNWVGFTARCYFYYLNLRTHRPFKCIALARVSTVRDLGAQAIREAKRCPPTGPVFGGWHFSYMGGVEAIITKLSAFAHEEYDTPLMKDPAFLAERIASRRDLYGSAHRAFTRVSLDELPEDVQQRPHRYAHLLLEAT